MLRNTSDWSPTMNMAAASKTRYAPEELRAMPHGKSYELVHGELVERKRGFESSSVGARLCSRLDRYCEEHGIGWALVGDSG
jgi:hypothetical protein